MAEQKFDPIAYIRNMDKADPEFIKLLLSLTCRGTSRDIIEESFPEVAGVYPSIFTLVSELCSREDMTDHKMLQKVLRIEYKARQNLSDIINDKSTGLQRTQSSVNITSSPLSSLPPPPRSFLLPSSSYVTIRSQGDDLEAGIPLSVTSSLNGEITNAEVVVMKRPSSSTSSSAPKKTTSEAPSHEPRVGLKRPSSSTSSSPLKRYVINHTLGVLPDKAIVCTCRKRTVSESINMDEQYDLLIFRDVCNTSLNLGLIYNSVTKKVVTIEKFACFFWKDGMEKRWLSHMKRLEILGMNVIDSYLMEEKPGMIQKVHKAYHEAFNETCPGGCNHPGKV